MIELKELRIGNRVSLLGDIIKVDAIYPDSISAKMGTRRIQYRINKVDPVTLTDEILLKVGLETDGVVWKKGWFELWYSSNAESYQVRLYRIGTGIEKSLNIKYLHQLQNLYFVLTGEELEIRL